MHLGAGTTDAPKTCPPVVFVSICRERTSTYAATLNSVETHSRWTYCTSSTIRRLQNVPVCRSSVLKFHVLHNQEFSTHYLLVWYRRDTPYNVTVVVRWLTQKKFFLHTHFETLGTAKRQDFLKVCRLLVLPENPLSTNDVLRYCSLLFRALALANQNLPLHQ